jgi:hypothetical protein
MTRSTHEAEVRVDDPLDEEIQWAISAGRLPHDFLEKRSPDSPESKEKKRKKKKRLQQAGVTPGGDGDGNSSPKIARSSTGNRTGSVGSRPYQKAHPKTKKFDDRPRWSANTTSNALNSGDLGEEIKELAEQQFLPRDLARKVLLGHIRLKSAFMLRWLRWRTEDECQYHRKLADYRAACVAVFLAIFALVFFLRAGVNWVVHIESIQSAANRSSNALIVKAGETEPVPAEVKLPETTQGDNIVLNEDGEITKVTGGSPQDVLLDFCRFSDECLSGSNLQLARGSNRASGVRYGIFTANDGPMTLMTLTIHHHTRNRSWSAGDSQRPVMLIPEERVPLESVRVDVGTAKPET